MVAKIFQRIKEKFFSDQDIRSKKMNKNILVMIIVRLLSISVSLLFVPLYLNSIDRSDYGILITLTSMIGWIGLLDIGFGNGLRNKLTIAIAKNDLLKARKYVSSAYSAITIYILFVSILFFSVSHLLSWSSILNLDESRENEMYILVNLTFLFFGINFILGVINSIIFSIQEPAMQSVINLITQLVSFVVIFISIKFFAITSILFLGILNVALSPFILLLVSINLFKKKLKPFAPGWKFIEMNSIKEMLSIGLKFFILQIITLVLFSINNYLILHVSGPESVVEYSIAYRYIDVLAIVFTIFVTPVWSAATDAFAKSDIHWIQKTVRRMLNISFLIIIGGVIMILLSRPVFELWLGEGTIHINYITLSLVLLFVIFRMLYQSYGYIINGAGMLKAQMAITSILAFLYIPLALMLSTFIGFYGVLVISAVTQFVNFIWSKKQYYHIINRTGNKFWHE